MSKHAININRWQNKVRALLGIRGENPIPTIDELQQVIVIENDRPEWGYPGGELLLWNLVTVAAVAAENGWVAVVNREASGKIVVVDECFVDQAAQVFTVGPSFVAAVAPFLANEDGSGTMNARDFRMEKPIGPVAEVGSTQLSFGTSLPANFGANGFIGPVYRLQAGVASRLEVVVTPDTALLVANITINQQISVAFRVRERPQERGILS